jgi:hypothetical protein
VLGYPPHYLPNAPDEDIEPNAHPVDLIASLHGNAARQIAFDLDNILCQAGSPAQDEIRFTGLCSCSI